MTSSLIHSSKLNEAFDVFSRMIERNDKAPLTHINESQYFKVNEKYKDRVVEEAQNKLAIDRWSADLIGSGQILKFVLSAIEVKINGKLNNLIDWRSIVFLKEQTKKSASLRKIEELCYELYKSKKAADKDIFDELKKIRNDYRLIAYLFFIKNPKKYLPLAPDNFDLVLGKLGIDFRTSHKCSWENYTKFINYVRQVQTDLRDRLPDDDVSLLDAHSYLWLLKMDIKDGKWETASPEKERVLKCLRDFSAQYPDTGSYENWLNNPAYIWALEWNNKLFPPKDIHARVLGKQKDEFVSGEQTTNPFFRKLGFTVSPKSEAMLALLKRIDKSKGQDNGGNESGGIDSNRETEGTGTVETRLEQAILRSKLLGKKTVAECGLCGDTVPVEMLIAAHIKPRSECSRLEKWDLNHIAMPMCKFGCDDLYELGFVSVQNGRIVACKRATFPPKVGDYLKTLEGKTCLHWKPQTKKYFEWHCENRFKK